MHDIQSKAQNLYLANLTYFQQEHNALFNKLNLLDQAIESGQYTERYALDYFDGYFDVLEISSSTFLYAENSIEYSQRRVHMVDTKKTGGVFSAQKFVDFSPEMPDIIDQSELDFHNALWATAKIIEYTKRYAHKELTSMHTVPKVMFLGIGLGLHIEGIISKLNSEVIFIKEDNLELFRLSLFVTPYHLLAKGRHLFFSIMENISNEQVIFHNFLELGNNLNLYIKHIPFADNYESTLQQLQTYVLAQSHIMYGYSAQLLRYIDSPKYLAQSYPTINVNQNYTNYIFTDKPVLMLFSGPSSAKHIDWLLEHRDRFILVTALSTCRLLNQHNLQPDIVMHIDPGKTETLALFQGINIETYFKNTFCIFSSNVDPDTVSKFPKKHVYFIEQGTNYKQGFGNLTAPSVGEYTYVLMLLFGIKNMFLLGLDLALDAQTLKTHADSHPFAAAGTSDVDQASLDYTTAVEYTKGNFHDQVPTIALYKISIQEFARFTDMLKKDSQNIYNLSDGAYLEGTSPLDIDSYNWKKFKKIEQKEVYKGLQHFFVSSSDAQFRRVDKEYIQQQIDLAKAHHETILNYELKIFETIPEYLNVISQLSFQLSDMNNKLNSNISEVYYEYFKTILSYIFDLFNTRELKNEILHMENINKILIQQLKKMSNLYIETLEGYLK